MKIILTNMCLIKNKTGELLFLNRTKSSWPGITFPGGHVEDNESLIDAVKREIKEETNLDLLDVKFVNLLEWVDYKNNTREIGLFYFSPLFKGEIKSSEEGTIFFDKLENIKKVDYSLDFDKILDLYKDYL